MLWFLKKCSDFVDLSNEFVIVNAVSGVSRRKKLQNAFLTGICIACCRLNFCWSAVIPSILYCSEKFPVAHLKQRLTVVLQIFINNFYGMKNAILILHKHFVYSSKNFHQCLCMISDKPIPLSKIAGKALFKTIINLWNLSDHK